MTRGNESVQELARRVALIKWSRRAAILLVLAAAALSAPHVYRTFRKQNLEKQTQAFVARGELQSGVLVARRLLALDENNLVANRAMAEMAEQVGRPEALTWRQKLAHLAPQNTSYQLALARTALRFGHFEVARSALHQLPAAARDTVEFYQVAGAEALALRQFPRAESHFAAALKLAPDNASIAFNLAALRLASGDPQVAETARVSIRQLAQNPSVRREALRAIIADAITRNDRVTAREFAEQLMQLDGAPFSDALLCFEAFQGTDAAASTLAQLQERAATSPTSAAELIAWHNRHGEALVALEWSARLPREVAEAHPVPLAIAESYSFRQDWNALRGHVAGKDWRELEALRLAVESHALHRLSPPERPSIEAQTAWRSALQAAQMRAEQLLAIAQLAEGWGYKAEAAEAWWEVAHSAEHARTALSALQRIYKATEDTRGLLRVAKRATELNPNDLVAANNCASLGLLLNGDSTARRLALRLHTEHPENRAFAATYAFALHTEGKRAEALQLMESFKTEELRVPTLAAYYVVFLVENGKFERAREFLPFAERAVLLPEEKQLLTAAARRLPPSGNELAKM